MKLLPAIDIQGGRCVRLRRGDFSEATVFGEDPVAMARHWASEGARFLHVVDLDGAREGSPRNFGLVAAIAEAVPIPVQAGGGFRSEGDVEMVRQSRVAKVVIGTSAVGERALVEYALARLGGDRVVVAVDAEGGVVKTKGWQERSAVRVLDLVRRLEQDGVREILYTEISRDGMMESIDWKGVRELAESTSMQIIASGGVTNLDDLRALRELEPLGVTGVIVGRALYEKRFTVAEALAVLEAAPGCGAERGVQPEGVDAS